MGYYPIFVEMTNRPCVVVGGGVVAERKVEALLNAGATVTVISPSLTGLLHSQVEAGKIRYVGREYRSGDLIEHEMAFVATDDKKVNPVVAQEARERGIWINAADDPPHCDFILPSVLQRGDLVVAVATGGSSPALSRAIREELESYFTKDYAELTEVAAEVRRELRQRSVSPGAKAWRQALGEGFRRLIAEGKREEAKAHLMDTLG
jgi:precorrin-2 dehydrogenase/sirohydrochlorin ferrochelatase